MNSKVILFFTILFSTHCFAQATDTDTINFQFYKIGSSELLEPEYKIVADSLLNSDAPKGSNFKSDYGELLTYIEGFRKEAQRNGNINWDKGYKQSAKWIEFVLVKDTRLFNEEIKSEIKLDIKRVKKFRKPYTKNDLYDRLVRRVVEYYLTGNGYTYDN